MIRPYTPKDIRPYHPTVIDIETDDNGNSIGVGFAYEDNDGAIIYSAYATLTQWLEAYQQLYAQSDEQTQHRLARIYAHNGANFDYPLLYEELYPGGELTGGTYFMADSTGIGCSFVVHNVGEVLLFDSYRMLPASLKNLGKTFNTPHTKHDIGVLPHILKATDEAAYWEYLRSDVLTLQDILYAFWTMITERFGSVGELPMTLPALALRIYRKNLKHEILTPSHDRLKTLERDAYHGGLTLCMRTGTFENVNIYDVNSMYPAQMITHPYPYSYSGYWASTFIAKPGIWRVSFTQRDRGVPPLLFANNAATYEGTGAVTTNEILYFLSNNLGTITIEEGYIFHDTDYIFSDFIGSLYAERKQATANGDEALAFTLKIMMNSLYGKFAQREEGWTIKLLDADAMRECVEHGKRIRTLGNFTAIQETRKVPHLFVSIAAMITANARIHLHGMMIQLLRRGEAVYYCDTDSIHTSGTLHTSPELGDVKLEKSGTVSYAGRKLYAIQDTTYVRAKGIGRNVIGKTLDYASIATIANDTSRRDAYTFHVMPSVKEVLSQTAKAGKMHTKTRRIRNTGGIWDN